MSEVSYNWIGTDGFEMKGVAERFNVVCPRCRQNFKFDNFDAGEKCSKMRAARAARSFWFFQPIILLLFLTFSLSSSSFLKLPINNSKSNLR